jgi:hypothetical protein
VGNPAISGMARISTTHVFWSMLDKKDLCAAFSGCNCRAKASVTASND